MSHKLVVPMVQNSHHMEARFEEIKLGEYSFGGTSYFGHFGADGALVRHSFRYLFSLRAEVAPTSLREIAQRLLYVFRGLRRAKILPTISIDRLLLLIRREHISLYVQAERDRGLGDKTIVQRELALKGLLDWLAKEDGGAVRPQSINPYRDGLLISKANKPMLPKCISRAEIVSILLGLHNESERSAMHFLYDAGLRISELCRLKNKHLPLLEEFDSRTGNLDLRVPGSKGKMGVEKERVTLLSMAVLARVRRYQNNSKMYAEAYDDPQDLENYVFLNVNGRPLNARAFSYQLKSAAKRAGIDPERIHPHVLRHSFSINVLLSVDLAATFGERRVLLQTCLRSGCANR